jgi:hypothetical protein
LVTVHPGSVGGSALQVPSEERTTLLIAVVLDGRGLATVTVKVRVATPGADGELAAGTVTTWVQGVPAGEAGTATQPERPQPSLSGPV